MAVCEERLDGWGVKPGRPASACKSADDGATRAQASSHVAVKKEFVKIISKLMYGMEIKIY